MRFSVALLLLLSGCSHLPKLSFGKNSTVVVPPNTNNTTLEKGESKATLNVPADTKIVTTHTAEVPATPTTPYVPAFETTEWTFLRPTTFDVAASSLKADSGKVDTTAVVHAMNLKETRIFLYGALVCTLIAIVAALEVWPTISKLAGAAAVACLILWKVSDLPSWFFAVPIAALAIGAGIYVGHKKSISAPVVTITPTPIPIPTPAPIT